MIFCDGLTGMTAEGNHGGADTLETTAALFMYSPAGVLDDLDRAPEQAAVRQVNGTNIRKGFSPKLDIHSIRYVPRLILCRRFHCWEAFPFLSAA